MPTLDFRDSLNAFLNALFGWLNNFLNGLFQSLANYFNDYTFRF
jgi:hypothetical protein